MSNIHESNPPDDAAIAVHPARSEQVTLALRHVLADASDLAETARVEEFLALSQPHGFDPLDLWVAEHGGQILWSALFLSNPGKTLLIFSPGYAPGAGQLAGAVKLLRTVLPLKEAGGILLAQTLLDPAIQANHQLYESCGFTRMAELLYLQSPLRGSSPFPALAEGFSWMGYSEATHELFARTIAESYRESLDCPALNGLRDMGDVIAGHKAVGSFDPSRWFLLCRRGKPCAVLLLALFPPTQTLELVYLGLIPEARGMGLGDLLMRQAMACVAQAKARRLSLAVDAGNAPALQLYFRNGMQRLCARSAMLRSMGKAAG